MKIEHFQASATANRRALRRPKEGRTSWPTRRRQNGGPGDRTDRNDAPPRTHQSANGAADREKRSLSIARQRRDVLATAELQFEPRAAERNRFQGPAAVLLNSRVFAQKCQTLWKASFPLGRPGSLEKVPDTRRGAKAEL